jgi:hypothetical protein
VWGSAYLRRVHNPYRLCKTSTNGSMLTMTDQPNQRTLVLRVAAARSVRAPSSAVFYIAPGLLNTCIALMATYDLVVCSVTDMGAVPRTDLVLVTEPDLWRRVRDVAAALGLLRPQAVGPVPAEAADHGDADVSVARAEIARNAQAAHRTLEQAGYQGAVRPITESVKTATPDAESLRDARAFMAHPMRWAFVALGTDVVYRVLHKNERRLDGVSTGGRDLPPNRCAVESQIDWLTDLFRAWTQAVAFPGVVEAAARCEVGVVDYEVCEPVGTWAAKYWAHAGRWPSARALAERVVTEFGRMV